MSYEPDAAFRSLYGDYTGQGSIGARLTERMAALAADQPTVVEVVVAD